MCVNHSEQQRPWFQLPTIYVEQTSYARSRRPDNHLNRRKGPESASEIPMCVFGFGGWPDIIARDIIKFGNGVGESVCVCVYGIPRVDSGGLVSTRLCIQIESLRAIGYAVSLTLGLIQSHYVNVRNAVQFNRT